jgi:hypothetical protein
MTSLQRLGLELAGAVLMVAAFIGWWQMHNHAEQKIGATQCIISTTEVKATALATDTGIEAAQAAQLNEVVKTYATQLADSAATNSALADRVRDYALRSGAVCHSGPAAAGGSTHGGLPASQTADAARPSRLAADTDALLNACDADHDKVILLTNAYNDWRDRMIAAGKSGGP